MWTPMTKMGLARSCNQKVDRCSNLAVLKLQLGLESGGTFAAVWVQFLFHATMLQHLQTTVCTASICSVAFRKLFEPALADPNNLQALLTFLIHCTCPLCQWQSICWTMLNLRFGVICSSCQQMYLGSTQCSTGRFERHGAAGWGSAVAEGRAHGWHLFI
jgi:hypothetical protein